MTSLLASDSAHSLETRSATGDPLRQQVRGSSLLLFGRLCSLALNLVTQILIVRAITRSNYGVFAYGISLVELTSIMANLALDKTFLRYGAIYHERNKKGLLSNLILFSMAVPFLISFVLALMTFIAPTWISSLLNISASDLPLIQVLSILIVTNVIGSNTLSILNVLRGPKSVFFRKHLLSPILKLVGVLVVFFSGGSLIQMAIALCVAAGVGAVVDLWLLARIGWKDQLWSSNRNQNNALPFREIMGYSIPVLASDMSFLARGALLVILIGYLGTSEATADLRAVLPLVRLNELVLINFIAMFVPIASRLFASNNEFQLWETFRQTNLWMMSLSFPIFAGSCCLAFPMTVLLFGPEYRDAGLYLCLLSFAYYYQTTHGLNGHMLRVLGKVRLLLAADILSGILVLGLAAIGYYFGKSTGSVAAATLGIIVHTHLRTTTLRIVTNQRPTTKEIFPAVFFQAISTSLVIAVVVLRPDWLLGIILFSGSVMVAMLASRGFLNVDGVFPQLKKIPFIRFFVASERWPQSAVQASEFDTSRPIRIAYMMSRFPKITETFVLRELVEMERLGVDVRVYPLQREKTDKVHAEAIPFVDRAVFTPWVSKSILVANIKTFFDQPGTYIKTLFTLVYSNWGCRWFLGGAMAFFPKNVFLARKMQQDGIRHLHAHFASHPAMAAWTIHQFTGIPYSFTAHGSDLHRSQQMLKEKVATAKFVAAISKYNKRIIDEISSIQPSNVEVIHCGIAPELFSEKIQQTPFERAEGPLQIICIGTLHEVKGQKYLIEACRQLREQLPEFQCHLVGEGVDREMLEAMVQSCGLQEQIIFHGALTGDQVRTLLASADIMATPSVPTSDGRREGIPVVLMEGLGSRVAAIASDLSGIPELVQNEVTGLLTPPGDSKAIAKAIERLAHDDELRNRLADAGCKLVQSEFNVQQNTQRILSKIVDVDCNHKETVVGNPAIESGIATTVESGGHS